jgi:hypothetical protein
VKRLMSLLAFGTSSVYPPRVETVALVSGVPGRLPVGAETSQGGVLQLRTLISEMLAVKDRCAEWLAGIPIIV